MTHGEVWFQKKKKEIKLKNGYCREISGLPQRMSPKEASKYYTMKIREYFDSGLTAADFDSADDYFDFIEAKNILKGLR